MIDETIEQAGRDFQVNIAPFVEAAWYHSAKYSCNLSGASMDYKIIYQFYQSDKLLYIASCVKCGFTHASRAKIRILTPRDIKFRTILVRKTFP